MALYNGGGTPVHASELQEFALDEYVVTAARTETKLVDTPANISVVDAQTIEERHYQDVSEVLKDVPGANVIDNGNGGNDKAIILNGDDRVLIMVDGRRMNLDAGTSTGNAGFDMNMLPDVNLIERIEILKGAGGALYGSDAVGGVVNIITKKADSNYGKLSVGYGSNGSEDYKAIYSMKEGKTGVTVQASKYSQDYFKYKDYATDKTMRWPGDTKYDNQKISLKIDQEITDNTNLTIGYDYTTMEGGSHGYLSSSMDYFFDIEKKTNNVYAKYDWNTNHDNNGYIQLFHNKHKYTAFANSSKSDYDEKSIGFDLQQNIKTTADNTIIIGSSYRDSDVEVSGDSAYDENIDNLAFFINDVWNFAPSWLLNAGVRFDDNSNAGNETTLSFGINKKFNDTSHAYFNWGQVFRAPTTDDLFYKDEYGFTGNPDLNAETGESWTIGYSTTLNENTEVGLNYFESDLDDAIRWDTDEEGNYTPLNVDKQEKRGMELNVKHSLNNNVSIIGSYTYLKVENSFSGGKFTRDTNYVPNIYRLGINYNDNKLDANLYLRYGTGADTSISAEDYLEDDYLTVDMAITYKATKDLSFYAKGYNLLNESYAEYAGVENGTYDRPAQSRRFIVGAEYKF